MNAKLDRHGDMLLVSDVLCTDADVQQANHQVWFPGAAIEPVVEFGYIVFEMLQLDFVMSAGRNRFKFDSDMHPGEQLMRWLILLVDRRCRMLSCSPHCCSSPNDAWNYCAVSARASSWIFSP
jgi:hypothetical protein